MIGSLHALAIAGITVKSPTGTAWEFLVLFLVVIIGPPLLEHARLPGIIGLLLGGFVIGPHGLNLIGAGNTTVPELGQLGLLYLMFVAGVELDIGLVRVHRRAVILFGLAAFGFPLLFGSAIGFSMSWSAPAAILLGSLMASHTLLVYPTVKEVGLAAHRAVATAVGATVLTDTASLVVLAFVSGSQLEGGSVASIALQVVLGLVALSIFCFFVLPRLVLLGFRYLGTDRVARYLLALASLLAAATFAASFGIEGIVGAFFAGLGLNRLVPNEGPLMERIDFFGSAVFVPIFLVSVGMLLQPRVMIEGETLKLAALFILASLGGKVVATFSSKRGLHLTTKETVLMLGLTMPQAAATLASTVIGFNIGLFDQTVVNAVLVLILVSIVVATLIVDRVKTDVPAPRSDRYGLGKRVLVALEEPAQAQTGFAIGAGIAAPDGGIVRGFLASPPAEKRVREAGLKQLRRIGFAIGVDADPALMVDSSFADGVVNAAAQLEPSFVIVGQRSGSDPAFGGPGESIAASIASPVAIMIGEATKIRQVLLVDPQGSSNDGPYDSIRLAAELAARVGGKRVTTVPSGPAVELVPGQLCIAPAPSWDALAGSDPPSGAVLLIVLEPPAPPPPGGDRWMASLQEARI
jgi:Kef-type K+ transport system membrane component KefB